MSVVMIPKGDRETQAAGTWWHDTWGDDEGYVTDLKCPNGHISSLYSVRSDAPASTHHVIDDTGVVTPSVVCPREGCDWHERIVLESWDDQVIRRVKRSGS